MALPLKSAPLPTLETIARLFLTAVLVLSLFACASSGKKVELRSEPESAEISNLSGEVVGKTPLTLEGEKLAKLIQGGRLSAVITAPDHVEREISYDLHGADTYGIKLTKHDEKYFQSQVIKNFKRPLNQIVRELLKIQGLLVIRRLDEAERALEAFQKNYPEIAASYVMMANIAKSKGDLPSARRYLLRARTLDPEDPVVARMLGTEVKP